MLGSSKAGLVGLLATIIWFKRKSTPDDIINVPLYPTYDYIIVGSGSTGAVIASRLSEDPTVSVLLVEAGGSELNNDNIRVPLMVGALQGSNEDWGYYSIPQKYSHKAMNDQRAYHPRGRVLGGTSCLNYLTFIRGSRHDYNQWEAEGCTGWGYKDVLPYFLKLEDIQISRFFNSPYHRRGGFIPVSESKVTPLADIFNRASNEIGLETVDVNGESMLGYTYNQANIYHGERFSTARSYLRPFLRRPNLHISVNTIATKIEIQGTTVTGLQIVKDNKGLTIKSRKEIIVSAGAFNSPQLLMLSGIGPKEELQKHKIPVVADLPVGINLQDHMAYFMKYKINQSYSISSKDIKSITQRLRYETTGKGKFSSVGIEGHFFGQIENRDKTLPNYPDFQLLMFAGAQDEAFIDRRKSNLENEIKAKLNARASEKEFSFLVIPSHVKSRGTIRLQSSDPFDPPLIDPNYFSDKDDIKTFIAAIRRAQKIAETKPLQEIGATLNRADFDDVCDDDFFNSDKYWECILKYYASTIHNPVSTCRMGAASDKTAVVDPYLRVKGIMGLRVADASIMRNIPSGNTNAPCIMIGEKASDLIRGKNIVETFTKKIWNR